jgi:glucan biosynthesis protein C
MQTQAVSQQTDSTPHKSVRLHYLDWLRVIAILMVFLFHAVHPFDFGDWQVKNVEQSEILTIILLLLGIWGMPFFFLVAGASSWFALQRRTPRQYLRERFYRLLIPFIVGTLLFSPLELYIEWANKIQRGVVTASFQEFVLGMIPTDNLLLLITTRWFGFGFHLWFLGFLFSFALITLPFFLWLKKEAGQSFISWVAKLSEYRGGVLLLIIPLALINSLLIPIFPNEHDWADFIFQMSFFILGFVLFADKRFPHIIRRDCWLLLSVPTAIVLGLVGMYLIGIQVVEWSETPGIIQFYILQFLGSAIALCYSLTMLFVGMRFLDFTNRWLRYAQEAALPFFVIHQPVIIVIAFFVVQWNTGIPLKLITIVSGSFAFSIGMYELVVRRISPLRAMFGMKSKRPDEAQVTTA